MLKKIKALPGIIFIGISLLLQANPIKIFHLDGGQMGDNLASLYNAYVYAKKYNLKVELYPFWGHELFECSNLLDIGFPDSKHSLICVKTESDIINNLNRPNVAFFVNVLSERITPDHETAKEARALLQPNKQLNLDYLRLHRNKKITTVAVHVRKGNGGGAQYDGKLKSKQIFKFKRKLVRYIYDPSNNPFKHYKDDDAGTRKYITGQKFLDIHWTTKFPPEQFYIDQIKKVAASSKKPVLIKLFTDDIDPLALLRRFKDQINSSHVKIEFHNNRHKDVKLRTIEDLYLMSQCDILIRAKSGFGIIAEIMGNFKTVIFPIKYIWKDDKLIMTHIVIKGRPIQ